MEVNLTFYGCRLELMDLFPSTELATKTPQHHACNSDKIVYKHYHAESNEIHYIHVLLFNMLYGTTS